MDLMDLLTKSGGGNSIGELAKVVGLGESDASSLIGALSPALISGIQKQGKDALRGALESGGHDKYIDQPDLLGSASTLADGNNILGHLFGSKDVSLLRYDQDLAALHRDPRFLELVRDLRSSRETDLSVKNTSVGALPGSVRD